MTTTVSYSQTSGSNAKAQPAPLPSQASKACVLVVENHEDTRFMLRTMLEMRGGISVVEAVNGEMAIALAENVRVDLILMDTDLPLLDGYTVTQRIRELFSTHKIPIVILSGHAQPSAEAKAFAAGCTDYLVKPFALGELGSVLERYLSEGKAQ
ncbi:MAG: response regulator [Pyrinomonadaceae bacterium]|nr:response regulator [Pyrinomonadaceae bacterium]